MTDANEVFLRHLLHEVMCVCSDRRVSAEAWLLMGPAERAAIVGEVAFRYEPFITRAVTNLAAMHARQQPQREKQIPRGPCRLLESTRR